MKYSKVLEYKSEAMSQHFNLKERLMKIGEEI